ncbi:hypothetical protein [Rhodopseudomonas palustris]|nr:hypothetical protein [Rhodopseudomonas palustris]WAB77215.1 hypothetical protein OR798_22410 [Rhodopseudomonas palustris]WCL94516.1 hypothetical protein TX73_022405 [Rhodopseudomonas palustris CGA009]WND51127.1 hypothetical protein L1A21_22330 [Rhodopseudomonas palustris]
MAVIAMITVALCATFSTPEFFAKNTFLSSFITFELLNILAVILTVTLASIANIHLSLNKIVRAVFKDRAKGTEAANRVRREINQNGWLLFWLFIAACGLLFFKGAYETPPVFVLSFVHSFGLVLLLTNMLVLCDIYQVIYQIVNMETHHPSAGPTDFGA